MLTERQWRKLKACRLDVFAAAWTEQQKIPNTSASHSTSGWGYWSTLNACNAEIGRLGRLLKEASSGSARLASRTSTTAPNANSTICGPPTRDLSLVQEHHAVVISGATGTGKTYLACALAQQACRRGHSALYHRASRLFDELALARADGTYARLLARIARIDVLVIDDWGLAQPRETEKHVCAAKIRWQVQPAGNFLGIHRVIPG